MWFPGIALPVTGMQFQQGRARSRREAFRLDHVTFDPDGHVHVTEQRRWSRRNRGIGNAVPVGDGRFLWLAITIGDPSNLRDVATVTAATYPGQPQGAHGTARVQAFSDAVRGSTGVILRMNGAAPWTPSLIHFAVIAVPLGAPSYEGKYLALPEDHPDVVHTEPPGMIKIPVQQKVATLSPSWVLQFVTAWYPGKLDPSLAASMTAPQRLIARAR
jgi:hypothetical protein